MSLSNRIIKAGAVNVVPPKEGKAASFNRTVFASKEKAKFARQTCVSQADEVGQSVQSDSSKQHLIEDAYNRGFKDGRKRGKAEANEGLSPLLAALEKAVCDISDHKNVLCEQIEEGAVELAFAMAEKIIRREANLDRTIVKSLLKEIFSEFNEKEDVLIRISSDDYFSLKGSLPELFGDTSKKMNVRFEKDPLVEPGGAIVETKALVIDGRIEEQLQSLREITASRNAEGETRID